MATKDFEGFNVVVANGFNITCTQKMTRLVVMLDNYTLNNDFYVVDLADTNIVLGVQWLHSLLGAITMNYQVMEMKFNTTNNKMVVPRGMSNGGPNIVSAKSMEAFFKHEDVACASECLITAQEKAEN
jgi:hypothetical protein